MTKVIIHGCNGRMGRYITDLCAQDEEMEAVAGVDICAQGECGYPVFERIADCDIEADVIIDVSTANAVDALLDYSVERKLPVVVCTTGLSEAQLEKLESASKKTAVLKSANMSLGINTLIELLKKAAAVFAPAGFDMEIVEKHHNQKLDAPSGTALAMADAMNGALENAYAYKFDRSGERKKRETYEIGISAVRGGNIVGEHEVIFAGQDEVVTFTHTAYSRAVLARGALEAARFLSGRAPGRYEMADVVAAR